MKQITKITGLILSLASLLLFTACGEEEETILPQQKKLSAAIYASGNLLPEDEYRVFSTVDGYLQQTFIKEGDTVKKDQPLFHVSNKLREAREDADEALLQRTIPATENAPMLKELRGKLELAKLKMEQDQLQQKRYKSLYEQNAVSRNSFEKVYLQYQISLREYENLQRLIEQQELNNQIQLQQARNQFSLSRTQQDEGKIQSFGEGVVYEIYKNPGDLITPNHPLALIGSGNLVARLSVDEDDLASIYKGQKVLISMDAYEGKVFKAHIEKIYPLLNKVEQTFRVDAVFDEELPVGIYGLNLEANIVLTEDKEVLAVPRTILLKGDSLSILKDGEPVKVAVKTGIYDESWIEITEGIDGNTQILK